MSVWLRCTNTRPSGPTSTPAQSHMEPRGLGSPSPSQDADIQRKRVDPTPEKHRHNHGKKRNVRCFPYS